MRRSALVVLAAAVSLSGACAEERERAEQTARETATSVAERADQATRLKASLTGAGEAPAQGDPDGAGTASVDLDVSKGEVCYEVSVQKLDRPVGMHIHEAEAGKSGPVVVPLTTPTGGDTTTRGCASADRTLLTRMAADPDNFYVNVHTDTYPQGAVRGQLSQ